MPSFWEVDEPEQELLPKPQTAVAKVNSGLTKDRHAQIKSIEDELLVSALTTMRDVDRFKEIDVIEVDDGKIPKAWVDELGLAKARERYRVALVGASPSKDAPIALKMDMAMAVGIVKARATEQAGPRVMNATLIQINGDPRVTEGAVARVYERKEPDE